MVYELILEYFNRSKCIFLGHSFGPVAGTFARLSPLYIQIIIRVDLLVLQSTDP